jgi:GT2 family glycosyltransferase
MPGAPEASIIVPAHNEGNLLRETIEAVLKNTRVPVEVIVVDDESTDSCCDISNLNHPLLKDVIVVRQERSGSSQSRNRGAREAKSDVLFFLDAHCFPTLGWIQGLLAALKANPNCIVTPCISCAQDPSSKGFGVTLTDRIHSYQWLRRTGNSPYEVPIACGACLGMRKAFFDEIGGFDNSKIWGVEDTEISIRCWLFGYSVIVVPDVEVRHVFKAKANFFVGWDSYIYNALRATILHFTDSRLSRILEDLRSYHEFGEAVDLLLVSDIWDRYAFVRQKRKRDDEWLCQKFSIGI